MRYCGARISEFQRVRLVRDIETEGYRVKTGTVGIVVAIYGGGDAYAVEFENLGLGMDVLTLRAADLEHCRSNDVFDCQSSSDFAYGTANVEPSLTITLDTGLLISFLGKRAEAAAIETILQWHLDGKVRAHVSNRIFNPDALGMRDEQVRELREVLERYRISIILNPAVTLRHSHDSVATEEAAMNRERRRIV